MIINFKSDMTFELKTTAGSALIEQMRSGASICCGIEFNGVGTSGDELIINALEFAGINSITRSEDGKYRWKLQGVDGREYEAVMALLEGTPQIIETPKIQARYFMEIHGGIARFGEQREIGRLSSR